MQIIALKNDEGKVNEVVVRIWFGGKKASIHFCIVFYFERSKNDKPINMRLSSPFLLNGRKKIAE